MTPPPPRRPAPGTAGLKVLVTSAYPDPEPIPMFREMVPQDRFGADVLTDDPDRPT